MFSKLLSCFKSNTDECSICIEKLSKSVRQVSCGHKFHNKCISRWVVSKSVDESRGLNGMVCPLCMQVIATGFIFRVWKSSLELVTYKKHYYQSKCILDFESDNCYIHHHNKKRSINK